jgi:hypothetical protein
VRRPAIAAICLSVALTACATSGGTSRSATTATSSASRVDSLRITAQEIAESGLPTAYDVVERLRRPWLRRSGMGGEVVVYMDERKLGDASELRQLPAATVAELQYMSNADAVRRWGGGIDGAVIVIIPRR